MFPNYTINKADGPEQVSTFGNRPSQVYASSGTGYTLSPPKSGSVSYFDYPFWGGDHDREAGLKRTTLTTPTPRPREKHAPSRAGTAVMSDDGPSSAFASGLAVDRWYERSHESEDAIDTLNKDSSRHWSFEGEDFGNGEDFKIDENIKAQEDFKREKSAEGGQYTGRDTERHKTDSSSIGDVESETALSVQSSRTEGSSDRSSSSDSDDKPFPCQYSQTAIAHVKHELVDSLMRDVYSIIGSHWNVAIRTHVSPESEGRDAPSLISPMYSDNSRRDAKKRMRDRESFPPGDGQGKRLKEEMNVSGTRSKDRLLACPFYKNNPCKYRVNDESGLRYRSCAAAPGFNGIHRIR